MKWFEGSVGTAIQVSRKNNALFVVFIESKNGKGEKMRELWDKIEPSVFDCPFVGIHLMEGDEAAQQFSQIYPTPVLPASYIIDNLGKPIEIITLLKDLDYDEFFFKLSNAVRMYIANRKSTAGNNLSSQISGGPQRFEAPSTSANASSSYSSEVSPEEKVERAKKLLEQKKMVDEEAKKQEEKDRELERIHSGKLMQEMRKKREEQELVEAAAQRRRDKIEAEKERERLKAQIKADREERQFRERRRKAMDLAPAGDTPAVSKVERVPSDRCRVQARLPNGENIVEEFSSSDCLETLTELIKQDGRVNGSFSIAQVYPRKTFSEEEMQMSFLELCLTPSCTLLVIQLRPKTSQIIAASPLGGIFSLFSMLFIAPLRYIYNLVAGFLGWNSGHHSLSANQTKEGEKKRKGESHRSGGTIHRRGNVTRLHNTNDDSDDENANWNGNSTQFL